MEYNKLIAVSGLPGLYELVSTKNDGAIVKSLEDGSTRFISSRGHQFSHLESIEIYTTGMNVTLAEVLAAMKSSSDPLPDIKNDKALKAYFLKTYPTIDMERVYTSDLKKMVKWMTIINVADIEIKLADESSESEETIVNESEEKAAE